MIQLGRDRLAYIIFNWYHIPKTKSTQKIIQVIINWYMWWYLIDKFAYIWCDIIVKNLTMCTRKHWKKELINLYK